MVRVYISVDMEGVAGVVHEDQTDPIDPRHAGEYNRMRRLMTSEATNGPMKKMIKPTNQGRTKRAPW